MLTADLGWYRFLAGHVNEGVHGYEDGDWQNTSGAGDHNEYKGNANESGTGLWNTDTMTAYCTGCHWDFHSDMGGASPWLRHPSDALIPNSGEYASAFWASGGTGTYDPDVPVARQTLPDSPLSTVALNSDMVMCLSCHRAHGSQYDAMLRWDYKNSSLSTAFEGCNKCHTSKY